MSHLTTLKTQLKNPQILQKVLQQLVDSELGGILTGAYLEYNSAIRDPLGHSRIADFVIRRQQGFLGGYDFGFAITESGEYEFISRGGSTRDAQTFMAELLPIYARENTIAALQSQGFEIESEILENGVVKIVAGKWQ